MKRLQYGSLSMVFLLIGLLSASGSTESVEVAIEKAKAVIMGELMDDHMRLNVVANPTSELCYGAFQHRLKGVDDWGDALVFPLARATHYSDSIDVTGLIKGMSYEYRIGTFHIPDASLLSVTTLNWGEDNTLTYDYEIFQAYDDLVCQNEINFLFGSCQYDGPLLDMLEKSPLILVNIIARNKFLRKIGLFTKLTNLPGYKKTIGRTALGTVIEAFALAEQEGEFIRTDDSEIFRTVIEYCSENAINLRGFIDMGDTYYRDWLNKFAGANNTEEVYALLINALTTAGRYDLQKRMPTFVQIDDHAIKDNYTKDDLVGDNYSPLVDACWRMTDILQRQMRIYDPQTKQIGYRWQEMLLWGLPVFIGDFRSEMRPGISKISTAQQTSLLKFLSKWGNYPKVIVSQVPIGPDVIDADNSDKWGDTGYQSTRMSILSHIYQNKIRNTFWLGGDIHSGLFADIIHTRLSVDNDVLRGFPRVTDEIETRVSMKSIMLAQAIASPFNWPIQFEKLALNTYAPIGSTAVGNFCVVNQSPLVKRNHAGLFKLSQDGSRVEITLLGNDPDNPSGMVALRKNYDLVPYKRVLTKAKTKR